MAHSSGRRMTVWDVHDHGEQASSPRERFPKDAAALGSPDGGDAAAADHGQQPLLSTGKSVRYLEDSSRHSQSARPGTSSDAGVHHQLKRGASGRMGTQWPARPGTVLHKQEREHRAIVHGGGIYVGELSQDDDAVPVLEGSACPSGVGQCFWPTGTVYRGEWNRGMPHGIGEEVMGNGEIYFGEWVEGRRTGWGRWLGRGGRDVYFGGWLDGQFHGEGTLSLSDGGIAPRPSTLNPQPPTPELDGRFHGEGTLSTPRDGGPVHQALNFEH